jgi:hypothetical protein
MKFAPTFYMRCYRDKNRRVRWTRNVARLGEMINAYTNIFGTAKEKKALSLNRCRWEDNIKMDNQLKRFEDKDRV